MLSGAISCWASATPCHKAQIRAQASFGLNQYLVLCIYACTRAVELRRAISQMQNLVSDWFFRLVLAPAEQAFLGLGSPLSLISLFCALIIATFFILSKRQARRDLAPQLLLRALLPRRMIFSASSRADFFFLLMSIFVVGPALAWAVASAIFVSTQVTHALTSMFGASSTTHLNVFACQLIATIFLFLAHELAYWTDHYLSHHIPLLWQFHKVHHAAEVLTPMTNARVHPVDTVVYANILAVFLGVTGGVLNYALGQPSLAITLGGANIISIVYFCTIAHLQHSHFWIATTGVMGRLLFSPAHHQIHHSADRVHFDRNFGRCLAIWDWMFGTLHVPTRAPLPLRYGVPAEHFDPHGARGALLMPLIQAWSHTRAFFRFEAPANG